MRILVLKDYRDHFYSSTISRGASMDLEKVVSKMASLSRRYVAFNVITASGAAFFPKGNNLKVGHITDVSGDALRRILRRVSSEYDMLFSVRDLSIFPNSTDSFILMEKRHATSQ